MEWPSLSDPPLPERRDTPALPQRKASWGQVPSENVGQNRQSSRDDNSDKVSVTLKPSLRDILEHEQRQQREHGGQLEHGGGIKITGSMAAPKSRPSVLSSFAIIQNQQLRDRNTLLKARHHKKSMYQIQIEEQALSQIRLMHLEQAKSKSSEGTGEWFTCEISV
ncbi:hypothetical protein BGZ52_000022 [Haplosporangium bisporale]|nr:hypothetical protein BGZ52_000022 [Haplosporangium bisporale]